MELIATNKGGKKIIHEGYVYVVDKQRKTKVYWRCEKRGQCTGRATSDGDTISVTKAHSHPPDTNRLDVLKVKQDIKDTAKMSGERTSSVVIKCMSKIPAEACGTLPKKESLTRAAKRARYSVSLDEDVTKTITGDDFLLFKNEDISICSATQNIELLGEHYMV